jgi:ferredoxin-nitrite reductase
MTAQDEQPETQHAVEAGVDRDFTPEQKRFLEGLVAGISAVRGTGSPAAPAGPDGAHLAAMARFEAAGKRLADQEKWKREQHPFDAYARLTEQAATDAAPKPDDNFRWRFYGLFYAAPTQNSYMCRLRIPNGILSAAQFEGLADLAERYGGGYAHVTTRANLQVREIAPRNAVAMIEAIQDLGLCSRGAGADNIRNVTGDATAGISRQELIDTRPYARAWHFHILNDRSLYGLPRKFNTAFDGGGEIPTLEDTNDMGFQAVRVLEGAHMDGSPVEPGVWFRLMLGGVSGHKDLSRDTGVIVRPQEAIKVADAVVRVFIREGDRTNRAKARLKYVLDAWGIDKFLHAVEEILGRKLTRVDTRFLAPRPPQDRHAHVGPHPQKQDGLYYLGVVLPVGKLTVAQMRGLARIAVELGDRQVRLTVWQNLLLPGLPAGALEAAEARVEELGLDWRATSIRAGLVACTGNTGCKFANSNTKDTAERIARHVEPQLALDQPINIHLTGCPNSCAQAYVGDIGLIGAKVATNEDGDTVEGYHVVVGGGYGADAAIGRELFRDVKAEDAPHVIEKMLRAYLEHRAGPSETCAAFSRRHDIEALKKLIEISSA